MDIGVTSLEHLADTGGPAASLRLEVIPAPASPGTVHATYTFTKRALDVVVAFFALVALIPVLLLVAVLIRITSRGPVLFRQSRVGHGGRTFTVLKFRSMCADAEARLHHEGLYDDYVSNGFKLHATKEPRVTRVGRLLRRSSLDEFPQLINVLRGDMSLVGPRPVVPQELSNYGDLADCYLGVRPGLTGMWQVSGRSQVGFPQRAHLDREYFERRSLRLDLEILARTPGAVMRAEGAY